MTTDFVLMPVNHAVRYLTDETPWQRVEDAHAVGDMPDVSAAEFDTARVNLLLGARQGSVSVWAKMIIRKHPPNPEPARKREAYGSNEPFSDPVWQGFLQQKLEEGKLRSIQDRTPYYISEGYIELPNTELHASRIDWKTGRYTYKGVMFEIDAEVCVVSPDDVEASREVRTHTHNEKERMKNIAKLLVAMSKHAYNYDHYNDGNDAGGITRLKGHLELNGFKTSRDTIYKIINWAYREAPPKPADDGKSKGNDTPMG